MARVKKLTNYTYSPTNPGSEDDIREQIDDSIQEVYDYAADGSATVNLTGNQTVGGVKTFSSSPVVPTPTTDMQTSTKKYVDDTVAGVVLGQIPDDSLTNAKLGTDVKVGSLATLTTTDKTSVTASVNEHYGKTASTGAHGLDSSIAKFKSGNSTYTDNDTSQTFTDAFCTTSSMVVVSITSGTKPQGVWTVTSGTGDFTITSTVAESADITFDYYITKVV